MSLNKQKMIREIGRRTRLKNRDVQAVIEALMEVWTEALVNGERIELEGFCVIVIEWLERRHLTSQILYSYPVARLRLSKKMRLRLIKPPKI